MCGRKKASERASSGSGALSARQQWQNHRTSRNVWRDEVRLVALWTVLRSLYIGVKMFG